MYNEFIRLPAGSALCHRRSRDALYIKKITKQTGTKTFLSLEHRMLYGADACLGCTIQTDEGNLRVCKDGPVANSEIIHFAHRHKKNCHYQKILNLI